MRKEKNKNWWEKKIGGMKQKQSLEIYSSKNLYQKRMPQNNELTIDIHKLEEKIKTEVTRRKEISKRRNS